MEAKAVKEFGAADAIKWQEHGGHHTHRAGVGGSSSSRSKAIEEPLDLAGDPEDDIKIIDQLLELQTTEDEYRKEVRRRVTGSARSEATMRHEQLLLCDSLRSSLSLSPSLTNPSVVSCSSQSGLAAEELDKVSDEIESKEKMLTKLRGNLVVYKNIKGKYNELLQNVESLETEKEALAAQLSTASKEGNPKSNKSVAAIKQKLQNVEDSLARARSEVRVCKERSDDQRCYGHLLFRLAAQLTPLFARRCRFLVTDSQAAAALQGRREGGEEH